MLQALLSRQRPTATHDARSKHNGKTASSHAVVFLMLSNSGDKGQVIS